MLKKILNDFFNITTKQAISLIFAMACFLSITTFIVLQHNEFYSYLNEDVACIIDMCKSFETEYSLANILNHYDFENATNLLKTYWKPPIYFIFSVPILLLINNVNLFLTILNFLLSFITLLSLYGIVKNIYSKEAGIFTCFILSCCPLFFVMHRTFFIETILMSSICIILYIITKNKFDNIYWNILFTITLTIALLTKEQIFIYYPIFILFIFVNKENYTDIKRILNIILSFLCSYFFAYILWYRNNAPNIFTHLLRFANENINSDYLYYVKSLYYFDLSPIIFILFIISIIYLFLFKRKFLYIFISFLFVLFIFSISKNKVSRHIFPLIIFCPILISLFVFQIKNIFIKKALIFLISFVLCFQFITINFFNFKYFSNDKALFFNYNYFKGITYYNYKPRMETYKQQYEYLKYILGNDFERNTVFINFFPPIAYNFLILQKDRNTEICSIFTYNDINVIKENINSYQNIVLSSDNEQEYNTFTKFLTDTEFEYISTIDIFNHTSNKTLLYKKK